MKFKFRIARFVTLIIWWVIAIALFPFYKLVFSKAIESNVSELLVYAILASYPATLIMMSVIKHEVIAKKREAGVKLIKERKILKAIEPTLQKSCVLEILLYDILLAIFVPGIALIAIAYVKALLFMIIIIVLILFAL